MILKESANLFKYHKTKFYAASNTSHLKQRSNISTRTSKSIRLKQGQNSFVTRSSRAKKEKISFHQLSKSIGSINQCQKKDLRLYLTKLLIDTKLLKIYFDFNYIFIYLYFNYISNYFNLNYIYV